MQRLKCTIDINFKDLGSSSFEVQVKHPDGWVPVFTCDAAEVWRHIRRGKMAVARKGKT